MASLSTSTEDSKASTLALEIAKVQNEHDEAQKKADELLVRLNALKIEQKVGRPATKDPEMGKKEASASVGSIKTNLHGQVAICQRKARCRQVLLISLHQRQALLLH